MPSGAGTRILRITTPVVSYTSLDHATLVSDLTRYAQTVFHDTWSTFGEGDVSTVFLNLLAYVGDLLTYQHNAILGEVLPLTTRRMRNFLRTARAYGYDISGPTGSSVDMSLKSFASALPYTLSSSFRVTTKGGIVFTPTADVLITSVEQSVPFRSGRPVDGLLGVSDGTRGQRFRIPSQVMWNGGVPELSVSVSAVDWTSSRPSSAGPTDEVFFVDVDSDFGLTISFGDGVNGRVPGAGSEIRYACRVGGGSSDNVSARSVVSFVTHTGVASVQNPLGASGGSDPPTLRRAKVALPAHVSTNNRAVVVEDFSAILFSSGAPSGIERASAIAADRTVYVWVVPSGGLPASSSFLSDVSAFLRKKKMTGVSVVVAGAHEVGITIRLFAYISARARHEDVTARLVALLTGEEGVFSLLGLGGVDDDGRPQITLSAIHAAARELENHGLLRVEVVQCTSEVTSKGPIARRNAGDGGVKDFVLVDQDKIRRREFRVLFTSPTSFRVYRRVTGAVSMTTDTILVDERLTVEEATDFNWSSAILNPDRFQSLTFPVDGVASTGNTIVTSAQAGSVFAVASRGNLWYAESLDGTGSLPSSTGSQYAYASPVGDFEITVFSGSVAFATGDEIYFDTRPLIGDVVLWPDELPQISSLTVTPVQQ